MTRRGAAALVVLGLLAPGAAHGACEALEVRAVTIDFGVYDPLDPRPTDGVGTLEVRCVLDLGEGGETGYEVTFERGRADARAARTMVSDAGILEYEIFADPARLAVWGGEGGAGAGLRGVVGGTGQGAGVHPVYGRIFARQPVTAGSYSDHVTVTVSF